MSNSLLEKSVIDLQKQMAEVEEKSLNLSKIIENELIVLIQEAAINSGNNELSYPVLKFRVGISKFSSEGFIEKSYSVMIDPKEKFIPEKFIGMNYTFGKAKDDYENLLQRGRLKVANAIKKSISRIMDDDFLLNILAENLEYSHITVDLKA